MDDQFKFRLILWGIGGVIGAAIAALTHPIENISLGLNIGGLTVVGLIIGDMFAEQIIFPGRW